MDLWIIIRANEHITKSAVIVIVISYAAHIGIGRHRRSKVDEDGWLGAFQRYTKELVRRCVEESSPCDGIVSDFEGQTRGSPVS